MKRLLSVLAALAVVSGCAGVSGTVPPHLAGFKTGGTLTVGVVGDMTYADPALASDVTSTYIANQVVEGLVGLAPGSNTAVVPVLAASLPQVGGNGLTYTFKLRTGIKFHDGTDLDAAAVKFNYERWNGLPKGDLQNAATDFRAVFGGFGEAGNLASVAATDSQTVVITLRKPQSNFLISQANAAFGILSPTSIRNNDGNNPSLAKNPYALGLGGKGKTMVGTGPFVFGERVAGDHVTLLKNSSYWNQGLLPYVDRIVFKPFADAINANNALQSGSVDMVDVVDPATLKSLRGSNSVRILDRGDSCNLTQLAINNAGTVNGTVNLLADPNVRRAIASAVNKRQYVTDVYAGAAVVADNWAPAGSLYYKAENLPGFDINRAMGYKTLAGLASAKLSVELAYPTGGSPAPLTDARALATAVAADLALIGITVNLKAVPSSTFATDAAAGKLQTWISSRDCVWDSVDYFIDTALFHYTAGTPSVEYSYSNDALAAAMDAAISATDRGAVQTAWQKVQDIVAADMPTVPLVNAKLPAAARAYVHGVLAAGNMVEILTTVWLDR